MGTITARVQCVAKGDRYNPHEAIQAIGGVNPDGGRWKLSQRDAIAGIESGQYAFFVESAYGHRVRVIVTVSKYGNKYIKTENDGDTPDNLLSLPDCP